MININKQTVISISEEDKILLFKEMRTVFGVLDTQYSNSSFDLDVIKKAYPKLVELYFLID